MGPQGKKRPASQTKKSVKRQKTTKTATSKPKIKAADRVIIPIPHQPEDEEEDSALSDQDLEVLEAYGGATKFLQQLDQKGISRSKQETERLHQINKPIRKAIEDDLPPIDAHSSDDGEWDSNLDDDDEGDVLSDTTARDDSDEEMDYELAPRKHSEQGKDKAAGVQRLPIKLADGRIRETGRNQKQKEETSESESEESEHEELPPPRIREDVSTGARFGRAAVVDVIGTKSRKERIHLAKEQIGELCQSIVSDPENNLGLLRRLHTFCLAKISTPTHPDPVTNDVLIRKLAILSQLAVFKDIVPGYRIRALTDAEKAEKVSQQVSRMREWEQGLLGVYQSYLRILETEIKDRSELAELCLKSMCTLLTDLTHFNFRTNLMNSIVARLSRRAWDESSVLCLNSLITVLKTDLTGAASLEVVRLLNRMIKEKHYNIRPEVLTCLFYLRLKTELGARASDSKADKEEKPKVRSKGRDQARRSKGKPTEKPHLSKKAAKVMKEKKEIEKEFREAEAVVDKEERAVTQTETLKLLFVLYFSILKTPTPTRLLPAALEGISKYAHMVNIDFFRDLLQVLKHLMARESLVDEEQSDIPLRLQCIVTAFELLSGQGEALNMDLADFVNELYAMIPAISLALGPGPAEVVVGVVSSKRRDLTDMLFRALHIVFSTRTFGTTAPSWRSAAFAKRLLTASMHWPPEASCKAIHFVGDLLSKDAKLHALLLTEDRTFDGIYRAEIDDPQLCNPFGTSFWELYELVQNHWDSGVREEARRVIEIGKQ